jgi:hypothetical protein
LYLTDDQSLALCAMAGSTDIAVYNTTWSCSNTGILNGGANVCGLPYLTCDSGTVVSLDMSNLGVIGRYLSVYLSCCSLAKVVVSNYIMAKPPYVHWFIHGLPML